MKLPKEINQTLHLISIRFRCIRWVTIRAKLKQKHFSQKSIKFEVFGEVIVGNFAQRAVSFHFYGFFDFMKAVKNRGWFESIMEWYSEDTYDIWFVKKLQWFQWLFLQCLHWTICGILRKFHILRQFCYHLSHH